jgi:hypothetical protein
MLPLIMKLPMHSAYRNAITFFLLVPKAKRECSLDNVKEARAKQKVKNILQRAFASGHPSNY